MLDRVRIAGTEYPMLDRVTITGADSSTDIHSLVELSKEFPFVEWGILASVKYIDGGAPRFPNNKWLGDFVRTLQVNPTMRASLHLCGAVVRDLLMGRAGLLECYLPVYVRFPRIQLNFHAEPSPYDAPAMWKALRGMGNRQFIFQIDGNKGAEYLERLYGENWAGNNVDAVPLFDCSHGAGVLPGEWPKPYIMADDVNCVYHGYAGGLGPDNLAEQLPLIGQAAGKTRIWIDMETKVRSIDSTDVSMVSVLDISKVRKCLELAKSYLGSGKVLLGYD